MSASITLTVDALKGLIQLQHPDIGLQAIIDVLEGRCNKEDLVWIFKRSDAPDREAFAVFCILKDAGEFK